MISIYWSYWKNHKGIYCCTVDIEYNTRASIDLLMKLNRSPGNPLIYWCYWMKHAPGIHWYTRASICIPRNPFISWWYWMIYIDVIQWSTRDSIDILMISIYRWYSMKHKGLHWYILMLLNETLGTPLIDWWCRKNTRNSIDMILMIMKSTPECFLRNLLIYWCYWMKHKGIHWNILMLLNETPGTPLIYRWV